MKRLVTICAVLLLAAEAWAQQGFDRISELRLRIESLVEAGRELSVQRDRLRDELRQLGQKIERLQARNDRLRLLPDFELEDLLRRSQEISNRLRELNRSLAALEQARFRQLEQLAAALREELSRSLATASKPATDVDADQLRRRLLNLRRQLADVDRQLARPEAPVPELPADRHLLDSNDPERLAQYAEALEDERDRLRRRLARLDDRLARARAQARLDQQMRDFLADQNLFGEQEHTWQATRTKAAGADERQSGSDADFSSDQGAPGGSPGECSGGLCGTPESGGGLDSTGEATTSGRLPVTSDQSPGSMGLGEPAASLAGLQRQRAQLVERLKRLQILYDRVRERLEQLSADSVP